MHLLSLFSLNSPLNEHKKTSLLNHKTKIKHQNATKMKQQQLMSQHNIITALEQTAALAAGGGGGGLNAFTGAKSSPWILLLLKHKVV